MQMRRFTRLTNAFSKKFENHMHMVALYTVWYKREAAQEPQGSVARDGGRHQSDALEHDGPGRNDRCEFAETRPARAI